MRKYKILKFRGLIFLLFQIAFCLRTFAAKNWGNSTEDTWFGIAILAFMLFVLVSIVNFFSTIDNIKQKSKKIRIWNLVLMFPTILIGIISFFISPVIGFIVGLIILLQGIFIYLSLTNSKH